MIAILTAVHIDGQIASMGARRVTANLPEELLEEAMKATGRGITETLTEGLRLVRRSRAYSKAMRLKGKIALSVDLGRSRERRRR